MGLLLRLILVLAFSVPALAPARAQLGGCVSDEQCNDFLFCTGEEQCVGSSCQRGALPCPGFCNFLLDRCVECLEDAQCENGLFCGGPRTCAGNTCQDGIPCGVVVGCSESGPLCGPSVAPGEWLASAELDVGIGVTSAEFFYLTIRIPQSGMSEEAAPTLFQDVFARCGDAGLSVVVTPDENDGFSDFAERLTDQVSHTIELEYSSGPAGTSGSAFSRTGETNFVPAGALARASSLDAVRVDFDAICPAPVATMTALPEAGAGTLGLGALATLLVRRSQTR